MTASALLPSSDGTETLGSVERESKKRVPPGPASEGRTGGPRSDCPAGAGAGPGEVLPAPARVHRALMQEPPQTTSLCQ